MSFIIVAIFTSRWLMNILNRKSYQLIQWSQLTKAFKNNSPILMMDVFSKDLKSTCRIVTTYNSWMKFLFCGEKICRSIWKLIYHFLDDFNDWIIENVYFHGILFKKLNKNPEVLENNAVITKKLYLKTRIFFLMIFLENLYFEALVHC